MVACPISPAQSDAPWYNLPSTMMPPPMPVPMVMPIALRVPRAAPIHHSPRTAQLASLSRAAGSPRRSWMIWRSGRLTQPRLGVSNTMPRLVSSGPGAPTPTPMMSAPLTSCRVRSMVRWARVMSRSSTSLWPASAWVGSLSSAWSAEPSSATLPTTRLVPPISIPRTNRTRLLRTHDMGYRLQHRIHRQITHAPMVTQWTAGRTMTRAGPAAQPGVTQRHVACASRPKSELGHRRAEQRDNGRAHRGGEVQRSGIVGHQHRRPLNQRSRLAEAQRTRRIHYPLRCRRRDGLGQGHIIGPAHYHHIPVESGRKLRIIGPALGPPDRSRSQRRESASHSLTDEPCVGPGKILMGQWQADCSVLLGAGLGEGQEPLDLMTRGRTTNAGSVADRSRRIGKPDPLRRTRPQGKRRRSQRPVRKVHPGIRPASELAPESPETSPTPVHTALVVANHRPHRGMPLQESGGGGRGYDIHWPMPRGQDRQQRSGENHVTEEGGLNNQGGRSDRRTGGGSHQSTCNTARNASCGISPAPICFIRFLPSFCFSRSLRFRVTSPP